MDLQQLRFFLAVAEREHFTGAAEALHISQPHLSRRVRDLERELNVVLFRRSTRRVSLTPAGRVMANRVEDILDGLDSACEQARAVHQGFRGRVRVGFVGSVTYSLLPRVVQAFRSTHPKVELQILSEMLTGDQLIALKHNTLDVGVLRTPVEDDLNTMHLGSEPMIVALPNQHPLAKAATTTVDLVDLRDDSFITYASRSGSSTYRVVLQACLEAGFAPRVDQSVQDTHTLVSLVAAGMGVALVPRATMSFAVDGVSYRALTSRAPMVHLSVCWYGKLDERPAVANFIDAVAAIARQSHELRVRGEFEQCKF